MGDLFSHFIGFFGQKILFLNDLFLGPIFIFILFRLLKLYSDNNYKNTPFEKHFIRGASLRVFGAVSLALIYNFYYKGGDTIVYYYYILLVKKLMFTDPLLFIKVAFNTKDFYAQRWLNEVFVVDGGVFMYDNSTKIIILIGVFLSIFCLNTYIIMSIIISIFSFYGCWKLFKMFYEMYPHLEKEMAIACLYIPSVFFWGTGVMKDPVCLGCLGIFCFSVYEGLIKREKVLKNIILILISSYIIMEIKVYIILSFAPAVGIWLFSRYIYNIKSTFIKAIIGPVMLLLGGGVGVLILTQMAKVAERYAFEEMMRTAKDTQNWLVTASQSSGGSFYTLGDIEYSMTGMLKIFPKAVNVSLFRPYIWEARKPMLVPAAIEGIFTFYFTVKLLFKSGFVKFIKMIAANPEVQFCLIFSIIFAFAVGFTSFNFGALARYKIPFMPFYYVALFILADTQKKAEVQK